MRIVQGFQGMLELVSDRRQQFVMVSAGIDENAQDPVRAGNAHRQREARLDTVEARAALDIDDAVGRINRVDQATECRGAPWSRATVSR